MMISFLSIRRRDTDLRRLTGYTPAYILSAGSTTNEVFSENVKKQGSLTEEARKETQEYIHHIGERVHKLQILAQKCYDAVKKFNEEMEDFAEEQPDLIAIDQDLRLIVSFADPSDHDVKNPPQIL